MRLKKGNPNPRIKEAEKREPQPYNKRGINLLEVQTHENF